MPINETLIVYPTLPPTQKTPPLLQVTPSITSIPTTTKNSSSDINAAENLFGDIATPYSNNRTLSSTSNTSANTNLYFLLLLLLIPIFLIIILLFICCFGRFCQIQTDYLCDLLLCPCMRPDDEKSAQAKILDATICYSEYDEGWLDEQFLPQLSQFENNFKIHKLSLYHRSSDKISRENEKILRGSKRIILVFSKKFLEEEWANKSFRNVLRDICQNDKLCVIICINVGEFRQKKIDQYLLDLETTLYDYLSNDNERSLSSRIKSRIRYNCGLNNLERLHVDDKNFWRKFNFMMPRIGYDNTKPAIITNSSHEKKIVKLPKLQHSINHHQRNDHERKSKAHYHDHNKKEKNKEKDAHLSYASNYKNTKNLRHIIVPIPDFMRTQLGYGNTKAVDDESVSTSKTNLSSLSSAATVAPEKVYLDHKTKRSVGTSNNNKNNLLISNQTNELVYSENYYNSKSHQMSNNKISIINSHLDFLPNQTNTLVKNYLPAEREVIKMSVNARNGQNGILDRPETPVILDMFRPKSTQKKMKIHIEEDNF
jgi:hypothetical protein